MDCAQIIQALVALSKEGLISCEKGTCGFQRYQPLDPKNQGYWVLFLLPDVWAYGEEPPSLRYTN